MGPVSRELSRLTKISTRQLWAPACTTTFFKKHYFPVLKGPGRDIRDFALYTLSDTAERDDHCAHIYNKSLLYLVSNAFEEEYHPLKWGWPGAPLLGMEKFIRADQEIHNLFANQSATWILALNSETHTLKASKSTSHGGFDDDKATVKGTIARIIGSSGTGAVTLEFTASASSSKDRPRPPAPLPLLILPESLAMTMSTSLQGKDPSLFEGARMNPHLKFDFLGLEDAAP